LKAFSSFTAALLACTTAALASDDPALPRDSLWRVVKLCERSQALVSSPLPCLYVQPETDTTPGYALVPTPGMAEIMLVPTRQLSGIESPELLAADAPKWWSYAWAARHYLEQGTQLPVPRTQIALGINSVGARSQDQLHIHIGCLAPWLEDELKAFENHVTENWSAFPVRLVRQQFLAMRLSAPDLDRRDPFQLLASLDPAVRGSMADQGLAVVARRFNDGTDGFLLLSNRRIAGTSERGSGSDILDPECTKFR
jgi:CDP-diacylglycerol pyrophosphatase